MKEVARAIITNEEGKVLLGQRASGTASGLFALIGGKPDDGESPQETVIREVKEEIGLDFKPSPFLEMIDTSSDPNDPWMVYYFIGVVSGELMLELSEISAILYLAETELDSVEIAFDHKDRLFDYFQSLRW